VVAALACALPASAGAATIKVTTRTDELDPSPDANCSVREEVQSANTNTAVGGCPKGKGAADTIELGRGNYSLTLASTNEDQNANGDLDVEGEKVTFRGTGAGTTTLRTSLPDRIVDVHDETPTAFKKIRLDGGDLSSLGTGPAGRGGNIAADEGGTITLTDAIISGGKAFVGGGLYLAAQGAEEGKLKVKRTTFICNNAATGGGLDVVGNVPSTISKSLFYENVAQYDEGSSNGGGISNRGTQMTITDTRFESNAAMGSVSFAAAGGAIHNSGPNVELVVKRSTFEFNSASTSADSFEGGGAIWTASGSSDATSITNSTFFANLADSPNGQGAVVFVNSGTVILANATLNGNGAATALHAVGGYMLVRNSILQGPEPCGGSFIDSGGYNLASEDPAACDFLGTDDLSGSYNFKSANPKKNGGFTSTFALKKSSAAVDRIPGASCEIAEGEDQRGYARPDDLCDIGSYERKAKKPK